MMDSSLISKIEDYLSGKITLGDLEEWYIPRLSLIHNQKSDSFDVKLIGEIELSLIEINAGRMSEKDLKDNLKDALLFNGTKYFILEEGIMSHHNYCLEIDSLSKSSANVIPSLTIEVGMLKPESMIPGESDEIKQSPGAIEISLAH